MRSGKSARDSEVQRYLAVNERLVLELRRHGIRMAPAAGTWLVAVAAGLVAGLLNARHPGWHAGQIGGWVVLATSMLLVERVWAWWVARYVFTDQRVILVEGLLSRRVRAVPLSKVVHTDYQRSSLGRILGYGDLFLDSPGAASGLHQLTRIPRPDEIYRLVMSLIAAGPPPRGTGVQATDRSFGDTGPLPRIAP